MNDALHLTIVYEQDPDSDWMMASISELRGVRSQGHTREEAREMVLSALNDWLRFYVEDHGDEDAGRIPADADTEPVLLSFAA
jgi:predicted RNase H-like HicB family nuclease